VSSGASFLWRSTEKSGLRWLYSREPRSSGACSYAAQNFSGAMARSARMTIVEAEEIVPIGSLDPNHVHLPGIL
jgi:hypothetical protein